MAYLLEGVKRLTNIPSYHVRLKSAEYEGEGDFIFGMVTNSRSVGGFKNIIGRHVRFDDGVFEVTFVRTPKTPLEIRRFWQPVLKEMDSKYMVSFLHGQTWRFCGTVDSLDTGRGIWRQLCGCGHKKSPEGLADPYRKLEKINEKKKNTCIF